MNKTIFITGAAKRIGKSIALTFKDLGWNIIIHYNSSKKDAEELANEINKDNPETAQIVQGNLDKEEDIQKILNDIDGIFPIVPISIASPSTKAISYQVAIKICSIIIIMCNFDS